MSDRARLAAVAVAGLLPWVVVLSRDPGTPMSFVFSFGLVNPEPLHGTSLFSYLFVFTRGLPESLLAWPVATLLWAAALASTVTGWVIAWEDPRVTGGLLVLAGLSLLLMTLAVGRPVGISAVPVGTIGLWAVAWWGYGDALRRIGAGWSPRER